jgi:hypothetical protein
MKIFIYSSLFILLFYQISIAQAVDPKNVIRTNTLDYSATGGYVNAFNNTTDTTEGSPYLFSNWNFPVKIYTSTKEAFQILNFNYNIENKSVESKVSDNSVFIFDPKNINYIVRDGLTYRYFDINKNFVLCKINYESPKVNFVTVYTTTISKGVLNPMTQITSNSRYNQYSDYFVQVNKYTFEKIKLNKSTILNLFGDKASLVSTFAKNNNLSFGAEKDVVAIFNYFSSL